MSKKISLYIGGRQFDVDVEDAFANFLEKSMGDDFNVDGNNDIKTLLQAYIRKSHELYLQDKKIEGMLKQLNS